MDPTVQVALISIATTFITTMGLIGTAIINNYQRRAKVAEKVIENVVDDDLDEVDVMKKMFSLITENERKERMLADCRRKVEHLERDNRSLRAENTMLRLGDQPDL